MTLVRFPFGLTGGAYTITEAILLDGTSGHYTRTFTSASTNSGSIWIKRWETGAIQPIFENKIYFDASDQLFAYGLTSTSKFRDYSAWLHIFWNNSGIWVNGVSVTGTGTYSQTSTSNARIGYDGTNYAGIYFADFAYWDGSSVALNGGQTVGGIWVPSRPSSPTSTITAWASSGGGTFNVLDVPTNSTADGIGNFCTLNPLDPRTTGTLSNGNLTTTGNAAVTVRPATGQWYYEKDGVGVSYDADISGQFDPVLTSGAYNFGQNTWVDTGPTGTEKAISTVNLPQSTTITSEHAAVKLYTGNGVAIGSGGNSITGLGFQPDFVWVKQRNGTNQHMVADAVRGGTKILGTDNTAAELTNVECINSFDVDGFTVGSNAAVNGNTDTYWSLALKAGGAGVSNTDGTITATVSANPVIGFSICKITGTGAAGTFGHGLPCDPAFVIAKKTSGTTSSWIVYVKPLGPSNRLLLDTSDAASAASDYWGAGPTSSVVTLGTTTTNVNELGETTIFYCFADWRDILAATGQNTGIFNIGSYVGNGSTDGPFAYQGGTPLWSLHKQYTVASGNWIYWDAERSPSNPVEEYLWADATDAEQLGGAISSLDFLGNGSKIRGNPSLINAVSDGYVYLSIIDKHLANNGGIAR